MTTPLVSERARLKELHSFRALDTGPDEGLDRVVSLAAELCHVSSALIVLVDEHRLWFKARIGVEEKETTREDSFCTHAISQPPGSDIMIVRDALQDERFAQNPYVVGPPYIRFYAGAPLVTDNGAAIGTLCLLSDEPRNLSISQARQLGLLRDQAMYLLEMHRRLAVSSGSDSHLRIDHGVSRADLTELFGSVDGCWEWTIGTDRCILSSRIRQMLGIATDDLDSLPNSWEAYQHRMHDDDRLRMEQKLQDHLEKDELFAPEFRLRHREGHYFWVQARANSLRDSQGRPIKMVGSIFNIDGLKTRERELAEAREQLSLALHCGKIGFWDWDIQQDTCYYSPEWHEQLGEPADRGCATSTWWERLHADDYENAKQVIDDTINGDCDNYSSTFRMRHADGGYRWILSRGRIYRDDQGQALRLIGVHMDVTEKQQLLNALQASNHDLERFAFAASHDLREPLRAMAGFAQVLVEEYASKLDESGNLYLGFITDGAARMKRLIDGILEYSRLNVNTEQDSEIDLNHVLNIVLQNLQLQIDEAEAQIRRDVLPVVRAHPEQMVQLLQNLISNSVKFRKPDGKPVIEVKSEQTADGSLIRIVDNGIGIEPKYHEKIFDIFSKLHNQVDYQGAGIGLAICKRIAEKNRARISLESELGRGTSITIQFPPS